MREPIQDHRAISVPLAPVNGGQPRILAGTQMGSSAALATVTRQIPKLIVRVRFPLPAPTRNRTSEP
jgi:hypothetical protein